MRTITCLAVACVCLAVACPAWAGAGPGEPTRCAACGCQSPCRKIACQVVCDYQEVEVECWDVKCQDYCLPIPVLGSCLGGDRCQCAQCRPDVTCGHPRIKKTLMLRTVKVKKPVYKCVTRYLCAGCAASPAPSQEPAAPATTAPAPKEAPIPPPPKQAVAPVFLRF